MTDWNWQKEAHERYITANEQGYAHDAQLAIAAALIAAAEALQRKPEFVQVGGRGIAIKHITHYRIADDGVYAFFDSDDSYDEGGQAYVHLVDGDATAFLRWWNEHANVTRLEEEVE